MESSGDDIDGITLTIDEADKPPATGNLGEFVKLFSERLTKNNARRFCIGLAGMPGLTRKLRASHESSPRIFTDVPLDPLSENERKEVISRGLEESFRSNNVHVEIDEKALQWISNYSEGYPNFIQQFAWNAFDVDSDRKISEVDVTEGAFSETGAFHQLGVKYFEEQFFDRSGPEEYRVVLRSMAQDLDEWVTKEIIRKRSGLKETTLTNAIAKLKKQGVIIPHDGSRGVYRLPTKSFAVWITGVTSDKKLVKTEKK